MTLRKTKFYGMLPSGEKVYLGKAKADKQELKKLMSTIAVAYSENSAGYIHIGKNVYDVRGFIGIIVQ